MMRDWQQATVLKYASSSKPRRALGRSDKVQRDLRKRGERVHCGSMTLVGRSDAAYGDLSTDGKCRLGYVVGLTSSTSKGPCRISQRTSKFARNMAKSSLGGEVYALSEMVDRVVLLKDFRGPSAGMDTGAVELGACESLFTHMKTKKMIAKTLEEGDLENAY